MTGVGGVIELKREEFERIAELVYRRFGINLTEKKRADYREKQHAILEKWTSKGVKWLGTYDCHFSSGWSMMAAMEYPDLETLQEFVHELNQIGRNKYFLTESHIGLRVAP